MDTNSTQEKNRPTNELQFSSGYKENTKMFSVDWILNQNHIQNDSNHTKYCYCTRNRTGFLNNQLEKSSYVIITAII